MKLRLTDYTYMDTDGGVHDISGWGHHNVNVPLFTYWLHDAEFKELAEGARLHNLKVDEADPQRYPLEK